MSEMPMFALQDPDPTLDFIKMASTSPTPLLSSQ